MLSVCDDACWFPALPWERPRVQALLKAACGPGSLSPCEPNGQRQADPQERLLLSCGRVGSRQPPWKSAPPQSPPPQLAG